MEMFLIYLWLKLDLFTLFAEIITTSVALYAAVRLASCYLEMWDRDRDGPVDEWKAKITKRLSTVRKYYWIVPLMLLSTLAIPSQKDTAILVGSHYALALANSPEGVKVQSLIRKKANEFLDEQLKAK